MANHAAERLHVRKNVRDVLDDLIRRPTTQQRSAVRAKVILAAADGVSNAEIARRVGVARQNVLEIRQRFLERGLDSVLEDAPRPGRPKLIASKTVEKIVETTMHRSPENASHWSTRALASEFGVGRSTVQRILHAHKLRPHRVETFKFSTDPDFNEKLRDVVDLYMDPPTNAIVLSVDEKAFKP